MTTTTSTKQKHPSCTSLSLRRRRGAVVAAAVLYTASTSCFFVSNSDVHGVTAFSTPSTKALFVSSPSSFLTTSATTTTSNYHKRSTSTSTFSSSSSRRAVASSSSSDVSSSNRRGGGGSGGGVPPGSPLEMICKDQQEFELSVGHAMDTLRDDYPQILTKNPDYSIYDSELELVDPSGVRLHGVKNYKNVFRLLHAIVGIFYCPERSGLTFRMCFDKARQNIRIHWNAQVIPKALFGGYKTTLHVDGISIYELDRNTGNITQHRLERLVINDNYITPEQGVFAALRGHAIKSQVDGVPVFNMEMAGITDEMDVGSSNDGMNFPTNIVQFQSHSPRGPSLLFSEGDETRAATMTTSRSALDAMSSSSSSSRSEQQDNSLTQSSSHQQSLAPSGIDHPLAPLIWMPWKGRTWHGKSLV
jgi:hypothetical protein